MEYEESRISAHHNYLVNRVLTPGFVVGKPNEDKGFFLLADLVLPGESTPRICARLLDAQGVLLLELEWNRIRENPGMCTHRPVPGGFVIVLPSEEALMEVRTESFANGYITRIKARLFDETGQVRSETLGESLQVRGEAKLVLDSPFVFSRK